MSDIFEWFDLAIFELKAGDCNKLLDWSVEKKMNILQLISLLSLINSKEVFSWIYSILRLQKLA